MDPYRVTTPKHVGKNAKTPQVCSCLGCGNQRRHGQGPTMSERRGMAQDDFPDEEELDTPDPYKEFDFE